MNEQTMPRGRMLVVLFTALASMLAGPAAVMAQSVKTTLSTVTALPTTPLPLAASSHSPDSVITEKTISYDGRSFFIDGKRLIFIAGSVHYPRVPRSEWRRVLSTAKANGINLIQTYVFWDLHEPENNHWYFPSQEKDDDGTTNEDFVAFVREAGAMGLYVHLRIAGYVCAEWNFGGFPGWLRTIQSEESVDLAKIDDVVDRDPAFGTATATAATADARAPRGDRDDGNEGENGKERTELVKIREQQQEEENKNKNNEKNQKNSVTLRTLDRTWLKELAEFTEKVLSVVQEADLLARRSPPVAADADELPEGSIKRPIVMLQMENEYGNMEDYYGVRGKLYVQWLAKYTTELNKKFRLEIPWIMCQQGEGVGTAPLAEFNVINTCNGYYCDNWISGHAESTKGQEPHMWTENWPGWFQNWGEAVPHRPAEDVSFAVARWFAKGGSYMNYYMVHGGTTFGRSVGGPLIITSYDYDVQINEYGLPAEPKFTLLQQLHRVLYGISDILLAQTPPEGVPLDGSDGQCESHTYMRRDVVVRRRQERVQGAKLSGYLARVVDGDDDVEAEVIKREEIDKGRRSEGSLNEEVEGEVEGEADAEYNCLVFLSNWREEGSCSFPTSFSPSAEGDRGIKEEEAVRIVVPKWSVSILAGVSGMEEQDEEKKGCTNLTFLYNTKTSTVAPSYPLSSTSSSSSSSLIGQQRQRSTRLHGGIVVSDDDDENNKNNNNNIIILMDKEVEKEKVGAIVSVFAASVAEVADIVDVVVGNEMVATVVQDFVVDPSAVSIFAEPFPDLLSPASSSTPSSTSSIVASSSEVSADVAADAEASELGVTTTTAAATGKVATRTGTGLGASQKGLFSRKYTNAPAQVFSPWPLEQLSLTQDLTDYLWYSAHVPTFSTSLSTFFSSSSVSHATEAVMTRTAVEEIEREENEDDEEEAATKGDDYCYYLELARGTDGGGVTFIYVDGELAGGTGGAAGGDPVVAVSASSGGTATPPKIDFKNDEFSSSFGQTQPLYGEASMRNPRAATGSGGTDLPKIERIPLSVAKGAFSGEKGAKLDILSVSMGLKNYGPYLETIQVGIVSNITLNRVRKPKFDGKYDANGEEDLCAIATASSPERDESKRVERMELRDFTHTVGLVGEQERPPQQQYQKNGSKEAQKVLRTSDRTPVFHPENFANHPQSAPNQQKTQQKCTGRCWYSMQFATPPSLLAQDESPSSAFFSAVPPAIALDLGASMGKGSVWVNGHMLGRYWNISASTNCPQMGKLVGVREGLAHGELAVAAVTRTTHGSYLDAECGAEYSGGYEPGRCRTGCGEASQRYYKLPFEWLHNNNNNNNNRERGVPLLNTLVLFDELGSERYMDIALVQMSMQPLPSSPRLR